MAAKLTYAITLSLLLGLFAGSVANADLVGWWKLDGNAVDSSDNGHDGVLFGDPEWVEGIVDGALKCDGVDDRIEMPGTSAAEGFAGLSGEVTWTMWMRTGPSTATQSIMCQGPAGAAHVQGNRSVNVEVSGVVMVRANSVSALTSLNSTAVVNDDQWHHIAVTIAFETEGTSDTMKVYIDGDLNKGYEADTVDINQHAGVAADFIVTLGDRAGSPFGGSIDDVRVYDHILNVVELRGVMLGEPYPFRRNRTWGRRHDREHGCDAQVAVGRVGRIAPCLLR
ncbi:MAG: LamG domain-containing protein [Sedimentisphaerales bacterium]|nr:LamG domain-containing protein [Sedimentisphaerales bacterium]